MKTFGKIGTAAGALLASFVCASAQDAATDGTEFFRVLPGQEKWVDYKGEETIVQMMGIGPTGKKTVDASMPGFMRINP